MPVAPVGPEVAPKTATVPPAAVRPLFVDVAEELGISFTYYNDEVPDRYYMPETLGGGLAWCDYDGDGRLDLFLVDGTHLDPVPATGTATGHGNRLYRNLGDGHFGEISLESNVHVDAFGHGCAVGDFDADGFPDFYLTNFGANVLLRNNGDGTFEDVTTEAAVGDPLWGLSAVWFDAEPDGDLDLYVANYVDWSIAKNKQCLTDGKRVYCGPLQYNGAPDRYFENRGDGTFVEAAERLGLVAVSGKGMGVVAADFDHDLLPEIYVTNDVEQNFLFTRGTRAHASDNNDPRPYRDVAIDSGCALGDEGEREASMGVACGDFDRNGWPDLFLTHFYEQKSTLYLNLSGLIFEDASKRTRIAAHTYLTLGFGTLAVDFDRDGADDLIFANGSVLGPNYVPWKMQAQVLQNDGEARFDDVSKQAGDYFQLPRLGRGMAGGDFDEDGDLDIAISHLHDPVAVLRNDTATGRHFLGIELQTLSRVPPVGGRVEVTTKNGTLVRPIIGAGSYLSSSDPRLLFGLGQEIDAVSVAVHWPSGAVDQYTLAPDQYWLLTENRSREPFSARPPKQ